MDPDVDTFLDFHQSPVKQTIGRSCRRKKTELNPFMGPSSHKDFAMVSTQSDSEDGWSEDDTAHPTDKLPDMYTTLCYKSNQMQRSQRQKTMPGCRPQHQQPQQQQRGAMCHVDVRSTARNPFQPSVGHVPDCTHWADLKTTPTAEDGNISGTQTISGTNAENWSHTFKPKLRQTPH